MRVEVKAFDRRLRFHHLLLLDHVTYRNQLES